MNSEKITNYKYIEQVVNLTLDIYFVVINNLFSRVCTEKMEKEKETKKNEKLLIKSVLF